jgi:hypothetical protein
MRLIEVPGGLAKIKEQKDLRGRDTKLIKAYALAAQSVLLKIPEEARPKPGESKEDAGKRMQEHLETHPVQMSGDEGMRMLDMKEAIMVAYLASWTLEIPLPTMETIGDLPDEIYQALDDAVGGDAIKVAVASVDFDVNPDQSSPTGPSKSSDSTSRAEVFQDQESISQSENGTGHSAGEKSLDSVRLTTTTPTV